MRSQEIKKSRNEIYEGLLLRLSRSTVGGLSLRLLGRGENITPKTLVLEYMKDQYYYDRKEFNMKVLKSLRVSESFLRLYRSLNRQKIKDKSLSYSPLQDLLRHDLSQAVVEDKLKNEVRKSRERLRSSVFPDPLTLPLMSRPSFRYLKDKYDKYKAHRPNNSDTHFGIEMEVIFNSNESLKQFEKEVERVPFVTISTDGSLSSPKVGSIPKEIKVLTDTSLQNLKQVCDSLSGKAFVNTTCGMHVHFDFRNRNMKESTLKSRISPLFQTLKYIVPESRRSNRYCELRVGGRGRYAAVNTESLKKFGTIEIRLHSGTIDYNKIKQWITLWSKLIYSKRLDKIPVETLQIENSRERLHEVLKYLKLPEETKQFYLGRYNELNSNQNQDLESLECPF